MSDRVTRSKVKHSSPPPKVRAAKETLPRKNKVGSRKTKLPVPASPDENAWIGADAEANKNGSKDRVGLAKKALHTSIPADLPCRETEINFVHNFLSLHILERNSGGIYISGSPGTGKTAVLHHVLDTLRSQGLNGKALDFLSIFINCMNMGSPSQIYEQIGTQLKIAGKGGEIMERLRTRLSGKRGNMIVVVLDEMDQLLNSRNGNDFLYKMFDMTQLEDSKLILVGIANSLDLTTRHLPYLATTSSPVTTKSKRRGSSGIYPNSEPIEIFHFTPYERDEIAQILERRLLAVEGLFDPLAIKLVATRVASSTGDMRKALNACKTALDQMEKEGRAVLKTTADDGFNSSSPKKTRLECVGEKIGIGSVAKVLGPGKDDGCLPVQQLLLLATLLRIHRRLALDGCPVPPISLAAVYREYGHLSERKGFEFIDMSDIVSIFGMLEDRSIVSFASTHNTTPSSRKGARGSAQRTKGVDAITFDPNKLQLILQKSGLLDSIVHSL